jgi:type I restriction enzyme M protein
LLPPDDIRVMSRNEGFKTSHFDFIITNPPFGSTVKQTEKAYLHQYRLATRQVDWLNPKSKAAERPGQDTEILFIEQCHHYLSEGGYLAIVIPDSILTNSSLQYVRDEIEDLYRIVAVVSLPQTAFTATGAGVKSSVLFLRKHATTETEEMRKTKQKLKDSIRTAEKLEAHLNDMEQKRKAAIKELARRPDFSHMTKDELKTNEEFKELSKAISDDYRAQTENLRYRLSEIYEERRRKKLPDYPIFMAIADDIGYDATGRPTKTNELEPIAAELARFITAIEEDKA